MRRGALRCSASVVVSVVLVACGSGGGSGGLPAPSVASISPSSGPSSGGTAVTISGANFQSGATVQFGSAQATGVTVSGPTSLSATTPAGTAGAVNVTVTNPDRQSAMLPSGFTYVATCTVPAAITSNMTLDSSCVWSAPATVVVGGNSSPVLTILAGATVEFAPAAGGVPGATLQVGLGQPGSLVANGTSAAGIIFTSASATPEPGDWGGVVLGPQSNGSSIEYATINFAGGASSNSLAATDAAGLTVVGGDVATGGVSESPTPLLSYLTVDNSAGHGIVFAGLDTGFGASSGFITVNNWELSNHFPFVIEANQGGTIPTTISATPATSPSAVVAFHSYVLNTCEVQVSTTWPAIPLPYLVVDTVQVTTVGLADPAATLTIAAPNTIRFVSGTELDVDPLLYANAYLQANGTPSNEIVFTSNQANPSTGAWAGINFWCIANNQFINSSLTYASIEFATSTQEAGTDTGEIAVLNGTPSSSGLNGPVIANCNFSNYADFGIAMVDISNSPTYANYTNNNVFQTASNVVLYCSGQLGGLCTDEP